MKLRAALLVAEFLVSLPLPLRFYYEPDSMEMTDFVVTIVYVR